MDGCSNIARTATPQRIGGATTTTTSVPHRAAGAPGTASDALLVPDLFGLGAEQPAPLADVLADLAAAVAALDGALDAITPAG